MKKKIYSFNFPSLQLALNPLCARLLLCLLIHSLASISFIKKTANGGGECTKINLRT